MSSPLTPNIRAIVTGRCSGVCVFTEGSIELCTEPMWKVTTNADGGKKRRTFLGELAHVLGENETSARWDPDFADVNDPDNLVLMCQPHHDRIDAKGTRDDYPPELIRTMEATVAERLVKHGSANQFSDSASSLYLQLVLDAIAVLRLDDWDDWRSDLHTFDYGARKWLLSHKDVFDLWTYDTLNEPNFPSQFGQLQPFTDPELESALTSLAKAGQTLSRAFGLVAATDGNYVRADSDPVSSNPYLGSRRGDVDVANEAFRTAANAALDEFRRYEPIAFRMLTI